MPVSWEAVSAVATLLYAVVVVATVIVGLRQLRVASLQVEHLRRATQLEGTMAVFEDLGSPEMRDAVRFVLNDLPARMEDPTFRAEVAEIGYADAAVHRELVVLRTFEKIGTYVKYGLLDADVILDYGAPPLIGTWRQLLACGVVESHRTARGPLMWENYEALHEAGCRLLEARAEGMTAVTTWLPQSRSGPEAVPAE